MVEKLGTSVPLAPSLDAKAVEGSRLADLRHVTGWGSVVSSPSVGPGCRCGRPKLNFVQSDVNQAVFCTDFSE